MTARRWLGSGELAAPARYSFPRTPLPAATRRPRIPAAGGRSLARGTRLKLLCVADMHLGRFPARLHPDLLPLGVPVQHLTVTGGTITASGTGGPGTPPLDDLLRRDL